MSANDNKHDILLLRPMMREIEDELDATYSVHRTFRSEEADGIDAAAERIRAVVTGGTTGLERQWFEKLPNLGLIAVNGVGTDKIDFKTCRARNIHVTTTPGVLADDVADMAIGLIIAVLRRLTEADRFLRADRWAQGEKMPLGRSLKGKRLGILGLGQIGRALARRAEAFDMPIAYFNRSDLDGIEWERCATPQALAKRSDVLCVCLAATPETAGIVDQSVLDALGPQGVLINVARGSLVDEDALIATLRDGGIAGAGLDVFVGEPRIAKAFTELPNVVLTPHQGSATIDARLAMGRIVLDSLKAFYAGHKPNAAVI